MSSFHISRVVSGTLCLSILSVSVLLPMPASAHPIKVSGQTIFDLRSDAGGLTANQRADKIQRNLDNALLAASKRDPSAVGVVYVKGQPILTLGGFYVATADSASARDAGTTPALLAERWAQSLKNALANRASVDAYVSHLSGGSFTLPESGRTTSDADATDTTGNGNMIGASPASDQADPYRNAPSRTSSGETAAGVTPSKFHRGRIAFIPAGMTFPITLASSISSNVARPGDIIEARVPEAIQLGNGTVPANSVVIGQVTEARPGDKLTKSGVLHIKFTTLRTPDGYEAPVTAKIVGGVEKYYDGTTGLLKGETTAEKVKKALVSGAIGAGSGAVAGTTIGAIAGKGRGAGKGAWSGAAIGAGIGVAHSLLLRKGEDVHLSRGTMLKLQLESPASVVASVI